MKNKSQKLIKRKNSILNKNRLQLQTDYLINMKSQFISIISKYCLRTLSNSLIRSSNSCKINYSTIWVIPMTKLRRNSLKIKNRLIGTVKFPINKSKTKTQREEDPAKSTLKTSRACPDKYSIKFIKKKFQSVN